MKFSYGNYPFLTSILPDGDRERDRMLKDKEIEASAFLPGGPEQAVPRKSHSEGCVPGRPTAALPEAVGVPKDMEQLEEAFVRAHALERREPGGGKWPFAGDGPWHLIVRERAAGDYGGEGVDGASSARAPRPPLGQAEVAELALLRSWLQLVPERDRKLVWIGTARLHAGEGRVPWTAIGRWLKLGVGADAVARRYRRALAVAVCRLNGWPERRAKRMAE